MLARARIIQKGRSIAVGEVDITDEHGKALGKALMTYKIS
jgi:acyl-coenzyme A thioesterase PaaI-like protein